MPQPADKNKGQNKVQEEKTQGNHTLYVQGVTSTVHHWLILSPEANFFIDDNKGSTEWIIEADQDPEEEQRSVSQPFVGYTTVVESRGRPNVRLSATYAALIPATEGILWHWAKKTSFLIDPGRNHGTSVIQ
jgi:hypothetical protein